MVTTKDWSASSGTMQRYSYLKHKWQKIGSAISVKVGRNGLGWGLGLHKTPKDAKYIKHEGDGKAPAGIFELKNGFGYSKFNINYPYRVYHRYNHCVDDSNSKYYNQIIDSRSIKKDYKSFEYMKGKSDYYKYGIVVAHNKKSKSGMGSCIFIHIKDIPTAGCTVMREDEIKEILKWLDKSKNPLLIQAPQGVIGTLLPFDREELSK